VQTNVLKDTNKQAEESTAILGSRGGGRWSKRETYKGYLWGVVLALVKEGDNRGGVGENGFSCQGPGDIWGGALTTRGKQSLGVKPKFEMK